MINRTYCIIDSDTEGLLMPITSRGYRVALFLRVKDFDTSNLAGIRGGSKHGNGYILRLGTKNRKYFVHQVGKSDLVILETDDTETRHSAVRELASFLRGSGKEPERATLDKAKVLDFLQSLEDDGLVPEWKLHIYYGDTATIEIDENSFEKVRTKVVFNNRNVKEAKRLSTDQVWEIRGSSLTLIEGEKKHYGHVFFDDDPTSRVTKVAAPMNDDLHEKLAERLVRFLS